MILTEFDKLQDAMTKVNLVESTMPTVNGKLVEDVDVYNKVQKLLACKDMQNCHKFLYDLDYDQLTEEDCDKVNKLYDLAKSRNFITEDPEIDDSAASTDPNPYLNGATTQDTTGTEAMGTTAKQQTIQTVKDVPQPAQPKVKVPAFTVMYSAMKDGRVKVGECYSNAVDTRSAKSDAIAKLSQLGFSNIKVLAIEAGDPDAVGCDDDEYCAECGDADKKDDVATESEEEKVDEDDMLKGKPHNAHVAEGEEEETKKEEVAEAEDKKEDADKKDDAAEETKKDEELSDEKKAEYSRDYKKAFKATLQKLKFNKSVDEIGVADKAKFWQELAKAWDKADPSSFLSDKDQADLNKIVVKAE